MARVIAALTRLLDRLMPIGPPSTEATPIPVRYASKREEFDQLCCAAIARHDADTAHDALDLLEILGERRWEHYGEFAEFIPQLRRIARRERHPVEDWGFDSGSEVSRAS